MLIASYTPLRNPTRRGRHGRGAEAPDPAPCAISELGGRTSTIGRPSGDLAQDRDRLRPNGSEHATHADGPGDMVRMAAPQRRGRQGVAKLDRTGRAARRLPPTGQGAPSAPPRYRRPPHLDPRRCAGHRPPPPSDSSTMTPAGPDTSPTTCPTASCDHLFLLADADVVHAAIDRMAEQMTSRMAGQPVSRLRSLVGLRLNQAAWYLGQLGAEAVVADGDRSVGIFATLDTAWLSRHHQRTTAPRPTMARCVADTTSTATIQQSSTCSKTSANPLGSATQKPRSAALINRPLVRT